MTSAANMFRQFFGSNDRLNHSDIVTRTKRTLMTCQPADATSFIDAARGDQGVGGASYFSHYVGEKRKGALRVSGENKDGIPVNVILYLKEVQLQRALDNNLVPGTKYAHFEHYTRTPNEELLSAFSPHRNGPPWRRRRGLMQRHCGAANKETIL